MPRWYHRIRRTSRESGSAGPADPCSVARTTVRRWLAARRSGTRRVAAGRMTRRSAAGCADGAAPGSSSPPDRGRAPPQTPHEAECCFLADRVRTCTTGLRPELAGPRSTIGRRSGAPGCARSSRQTVAALGAPGLQDGAATSGAHAVAETVLLGTATIVGLVGALHAALLELHAAALTGSTSIVLTAGLGGPTTTNRKPTVARRVVATEAPTRRLEGAVRTPSRSLLA